MAKKKAESVRPGDTVTIDHVVSVTEIRRDVVRLHMVDGTIVERPRTRDVEFQPEDPNTTPPVLPTPILPLPGPI